MRSRQGHRPLDSFNDRAAEAIRSIPRGRVATYGQIAAMAGNPRGARLVVWVLNSRSEAEKLPWHRVINSQGRIGLRGEGARLQIKMLKAEGVRFDASGRTDLRRVQWQPRAGDIGLDSERPALTLET